MVNELENRKLLYLYLDNESMNGYVGETKDLKRRHMEHKGDIWPGRRELVSKIDPVIIKADFNNMNAVKFAEHAGYLMYKEKGYNMLQKPPHPNIFAKYKDRIDDCKICDELGCDFTKERLEYILAVHRVSKLCPQCNKPFYYDSAKHSNISDFNKRIYCSKDCSNKARYNTGSYNVSKLCVQCNKPFYHDPIKYKYINAFNKKIYCSNTCSNKTKNNTGSYNVSKLCPVCNKPFYHDPKKESLPKFNKRSYCSYSCSNKGRNIILDGVNNV